MVGCYLHEEGVFLGWLKLDLWGLKASQVHDSGLTDYFVFNYSTYCLVRS